MTACAEALTTDLEVDQKQQGCREQQFPTSKEALFASATCALTTQQKGREHLGLEQTLLQTRW